MQDYTYFRQIYQECLEQIIWLPMKLHTHQLNTANHSKFDQQLLELTLTVNP